MKRFLGPFSLLQTSTMWHSTTARTVLVAAIAVLAISLPGAAAPSATDQSRDRLLVHVLNRIGFGPRLGDVERVRAIGVEKYIDEQLRPERIPDNGMAARLGFTAIPTRQRTIVVAESDRRGAPATMVRAGDDRDLKSIVEMGEARAAAFRFHLNRDRDLVHYAIAKKRLLAGLGPPGLREVQFFIAEEGASAAAYVVIGVKGREWTLEECGDRDPSGARVGAILQVLIARDPAERRPTITASLSFPFLAPQLSVADKVPSRDVMMFRTLTDRAKAALSLREEEILYWRSDLF